MGQRPLPPDDISPSDFFTRWVPDAVARDPARQQRILYDDLTLAFALEGEGGGDFVVRILRGQVEGVLGAAEAPDLHVRLDVETWRQLNRGTLAAPEAFLRRRVRLEGNLRLAVKLHLILG